MIWLWLLKFVTRQLLILADQENDIRMSINKLFYFEIIQNKALFWFIEQAVFDLFFQFNDIMLRIQNMSLFRLFLFLKNNYINSVCLSN